MTSPEDEAWQYEMDRLHRYNLIACILHLVQGMVQLTLSYTAEAYKVSVVAVTSQYVNWTAGEGPVSKFGLVEKFAILRWTSFFGLASAAGHFFILMFWNRYVSDLKKGIQRFRWTEYQFSASLILTIVFVLWGNLDFIQCSGCFMISAMNI